MKNILNSFNKAPGKPSIEAEVDEELRFHIDMQANEYESRGLSHEESRSMAEVRFGDVERIRKECIHIGAGKSVLFCFLTSIFMLSLLIGLSLRFFIPESHVNRVGDVMMMIGGLGILLVYAKHAGAIAFKSNAATLGLGLKSSSPPVAFDEQGRTPFERVRGDE